MNRAVVSGIAFLAPLIALTCASCTQIDNRVELQQAATSLEKSYGVHPPWRDGSALQELRPDAAGIVVLDHAIYLALSNNRSLRADMEVIGQARADLVQAGLLSNPVLSLMLRFPEAGGRPNFDFGLAKDFADLWLIPSRQRAAQAVLQQRMLSFTNGAIELLTDVRMTYASLQYQVLATGLQEQNLTILRESMEVAQARLRAGDSTQLDVNLIQGRYLETEIELIQLRADSRITQNNLLRFMGVARAPDNWKPAPLSTDLTPTPVSEESALIEIALARRFDVQAAESELDAAVADFEQQQLRTIQSLGIGIGGERPEQRSIPGRKILADTARTSIANGQLTAPDIESAGQRRIERSQQIDLILGPSLEVPLPIFDQNQAQVAKAQFRAKELQSRYEEIEQRVIESVRSAYTQRRLALDKVRYYRESLIPLRESNLTLAESAYQSGRESILTVLLAQQELIQTRLMNAAAVRDLAISIANLERQLAGREPNFAPATSQPASRPEEHSQSSEPAGAALSAPECDANTLRQRAAEAQP